ncbi:Fimbrin [Trichoplax sp. H2]|uniref:Fimbrin n=1 Tax=Trichoplax adhaerens TaxID=10228 RepID=B3S5U5_TRIAD|nr:hypothetical protein TRIADDRAFT_59479 [Trichoplax adhaerens]EDV21961.1 hypothetical protein TRIADDRAFT_59479 [Trichoplax adhaerens]RDD40319.1 Fimbrin [Trichoplax sp. H2]|eukprot:XP_002115598.1 hypothetical protein TRIADDRAFT_59479 [Trichoplax adhaerens]
MATEVKLTEDQVNDAREQFTAFDQDGNGHITVKELSNVMKACGKPTPGYKLREMIESIDKDENGTIEFDEFVQLFTKVLEGEAAKDFRKAVETRKNVKKLTGSSATTADGTTHSFSDEEYIAFVDWINTSLNKDDYLVRNNYLPVNHEPENHELFERCEDGILLCKMINRSVKDTVDERAINFKKLNLYRKHANQTLVVNSARAIGCNIINIGAEDLIAGREHLVMGLLWQIIRIGLFAKITLKDCPGLPRLLLENETVQDLLKLSPEELLLRWFNHHLEAAGVSRRVKNFSGDIKDSECYIILLKQIAPSKLMLTTDALKESNLRERAELMLNDAEKIGCRQFVSAKDVTTGHARLNMAFVANLFNTFPALEPVDVDEDLDVYVETREEKTFRNWMNSLGVDPTVNNLFSDLDDAMQLFQLFDKIKPGVVSWSRVNKPPFKALGGKMKRIENCNYAVELGLQLKFSLVGIGGEDIHNGTRTLTLALIWQMMRAYTLTILTSLANSEKPISDKEIVEWVNNVLEGTEKSTKISSFKDPEISSSKAVIDLVESIEPESINYENVCLGITEEAKLLNAKYAISMARKIGASVYALPEDLVEVKPKMVMTVFACLMAAALDENRKVATGDDETSDPAATIREVQANME